MDILTETKTPIDLNPKQELFCSLYATETEFFGNGVQSYIEAYDPDQTRPNWYKSACVCASQLLSNIKVIARINQILEETGLNDAFVDKQLSFLMTQHADFTNKLGAIKEYNKLKQRITEKQDITSGGKPIPIYGGQSLSVQGHNSNEKDIQPE